MQTGPISRLLLGSRLRVVLSAILPLIIAASFGGIGGMLVFKRKANLPQQSKEWGIKANPGPWGELYYVPFTISTPSETLPVREIEAHSTRWRFKKFTLNVFANFLGSLD